jgi:glucans biosynthesis protein C
MTFSNAGTGATALRTKGPARYPGFDRLRAFSMLWIVLWHAGMAYSDHFKWFIKDRPDHWDLSPLQWASMGFTLCTFFAMSGFFAAMLYQQRGIRELLAHRAQKLFVPLLGASFIASHSLALLRGEPVQYIPLHLWFINYLIVITLLVALMARLCERLIPALALGLRDRSRSLLTSRWGLLVMSVCVAPTLILRGGGVDNASFFGTTDTFALDPLIVTYYLVFFSLGWLLHVNRDLLDTIGSHGLQLVITGVLLRLVTGVVVFWRVEAEHIPLLDFSIQCVTALYTSVMVVGLVGLFHRHFQVDTQAARYVADGAYWFYLIHPIPLILIQIGLANTGLPLLLKYLTVVGGTAAVALVTYEFAVRYSPIGVMLTGRRVRPEKRSLAWSFSPIPQRIELKSVERAPTGSLSHDGVAGTP